MSEHEASIHPDNVLYPTPERVAEARALLDRELFTGEWLHPAVRANCEQVVRFSEEINASEREGIWTMTDSEFQEELRKARAEAWDDGMIAGVSHFGQMQAPQNPYEERKMTPDEIEEWRKTCPYPEALGA